MYTLLLNVWLSPNVDTFQIKCLSLSMFNKEGKTVENFTFLTEAALFCSEFSMFLNVFGIHYHWFLDHN